MAIIIAIIISIVMAIIVAIVLPICQLLKHGVSAECQPTILTLIFTLYTTGSDVEPAANFISIFRTSVSYYWWYFLRALNSLNCKINYYLWSKVVSRQSSEPSFFCLR